MISDLDKERLAELLEESTITLRFAKHGTIQQADALEWLEGLSPEKRTELVTALWYDAQQRELARIGGW